MASADAQVVSSSQAELLAKYRRLAITGAAGTCLENYDMFLYALIAPQLFDRLFFPKMDPKVGLVVVFATFAVGFFARPIGGIICGHFGDRVGRKRVLVTTLVGMGIATMLMGLLPSYARVGIWAPIFLVVLRICQGLCIGGQIGGAATLMIEGAPTAKRGFYASCVQIGAPLGTVLAALIVSVMTGITSKGTFDAWAWRIPFLTSIVLVCVGIYTQHHIEESMLFKQKQAKVVRAPIAVLLLNWKKSLVTAILCCMTHSSYLYLTCVFSIAYATRQLHMSTSKLMAAFFIANCVAMCTVPLYGHFSDRIGRRPFLLAGMVLTALSIFPYFRILQIRSELLMGAAILLACGFIHPLLFSQEPSFTTELFGTEVRYSGASTSKQLGSALGGGLAPLIAASLMKGGGSTFTPVAIYFCVIAAAGFIAALLAPESSKLSLTR